MIRGGTSANDPFAMVSATVSNGLVFKWRDQSGNAVNSISLAGISAPVWLRLTRTGNAVAAFYSTNGTTWTQLGVSQNIGLAALAKVGLAITSANVSSTSQAVLTNVAIVTAPPTITTPASASSGTITGATVDLSVLLRGR